jgi:hypothetical protein
MARERRIVVETSDPDDAPEIKYAFEFAEDRFDWDQDGDTVHCYLKPGDNAAAVATAIVDYLDLFDLAQYAVTPFAVEEWDDAAMRYRRPGVEEFDPVSDVTWTVAVEPRSVFDWRAVRGELERRNRPVLNETQAALIVPAEDEADAENLRADLEEFPAVGRVTTRKLGRLERWRARQQLFGNYGSGGGGSV